MIEGEDNNHTNNNNLEEALLGNNKNDNDDQPQQRQVLPVLAAPRKTSRRNRKRLHHGIATLRRLYGRIDLPTGDDDETKKNEGENCDDEFAEWDEMTAQ